MTTESPIEARLRDIEARCAAHKDTYPWSARYLETAALFDAAPGDLAWLVALVRRYRRALVDALSWAEAARTSPTVGAMNASVVEIHRTLSEALNED